MAKNIRNAANSVSAASAQVDNTAAWAGIVLVKLNEFLDGVKTNRALNLEVEIPLGNNVAHLFGKESLEINGQPIVLQAKIRVLMPENSTVSVENPT